MRTYIVYLLLITLLGLTVSASIAQQNQNVPKTDPEVEKLKIQLQTVENEKIELETKLAEANAKLINTEFAKLKMELKESNHKWLIGWFLLFLAIIAAVGTPLWFLLKSGINKIIENLKSNADQLIVDEVEKRLIGFEEAVGKVNILETHVKILNKEHAASVIEESIRVYYDEDYYQKIINEITEEALLDLFSDNTRDIQIRSKAINQLANRKSTRFISPVLEFLYSTLDSDTYKEAGHKTIVTLRSLVNSLGMIHTQEVYDELTKFLDHLLSEDTELKDIFLSPTVFSLAYIGGALDTRYAISKMKEAIPYMGYYRKELLDLVNVVHYFDKFEEPEGIKDILKHLGSTSSDVEEKCLELLQKYDPDFVREQREEKETANTESEESDESEPTE